MPVPEHTVRPCINMHEPGRLEALIESSLTHDWILRVEYADGAMPGPASWRQWGEVLFAIREAAPVMECIAACRAVNQGHHIRLNAEKLMPRTRILYCVYRAPRALPEPVVQQEVEATAPPGPGAMLGAALRTVRNRIWYVLTLAGMLVASLLLIEEAMA